MSWTIFDASARPVPPSSPSCGPVCAPVCGPVCGPVCEVERDGDPQAIHRGIAVTIFGPAAPGARIGIEVRMTRPHGVVAAIERDIIAGQAGREHLDLAIDVLSGQLSFDGTHGASGFVRILPGEDSSPFRREAFILPEAFARQRIDIIVLASFNNRFSGQSRHSLPLQAQPIGLSRSPLANRHHFP